MFVMQGVLQKSAKHQRHGLDLAEVERVSLERYRRGHRRRFRAAERAVCPGIRGGGEVGVGSATV